MDAYQIVHEINRCGGGYVMRPFGGRGVGQTLTREQVLAIPRANLKALVDQGKLRLWPAAPQGASAHGQPTTRYVIHRGQGKYDVIDGVKLNDEPVTKEEADALAEPSASVN